MKKIGACLLAMLMIFCAGAAWAEEWEPLPLDQAVVFPSPKDENYLSDTEYEDETISVQIFSGKYSDVKYTCARVKIADISQLRAVSAQQVRNPNALFAEKNSSTATGVQISQAVQAVVGINGDYYITSDKCLVVMRQTQQVRNRANGRSDLLVIDRNGDFSIMKNCSAERYKEHYQQHSQDMYQVFCFGPMLIDEGRVSVTERYSGQMLAQKKTMRAAIAQVGPLDYMLIVVDGDAVQYSSGLTIYEFAKLLEKLGLEANGKGFKLAYNLDGGNSAALIFKKRTSEGSLIYKKLNMDHIGRPLSDMICFGTLVR